MINAFAGNSQQRVVRVRGGIFQSPASDSRHQRHDLIGGDLSSLLEPLQAAGSHLPERIDGTVDGLKTIY